MKRARLFIGFLLLLIMGVLVSIVVHSRSQQSNKTAVTPGLAPLSAPEIRITDPQFGPENAPVTIVSFSDFGCDSCASLSPMLHALEKEPQFAGKLRVVWKDFPAHKSVFPESYELHKAARCAATQGKFWNFETAAFARVEQTRSRAAVVDDVISDVHLNTAAIHTCMQSAAIKDLIDADFTEGLRLSLTGTPTLFINEKRIDSLQSYAVLVGTVRNLLAQKEYGTH